MRRPNLMGPQPYDDLTQQAVLRAMGGASSNPVVGPDMTAPLASPSGGAFYGLGNDDEPKEPRRPNPPSEPDMPLPSPTTTPGPSVPPPSNPSGTPPPIVPPRGPIDDSVIGGAPVNTTTGQQGQTIPGGTATGGPSTSGPLGAPLPGYDATKWADLSHNTPKYAVGRILAKYPSTPEGLRQALPEIQALFPGTTITGGRGDKIMIPGVGLTDVLKSDNTWQWHDPNADQGAAPMSSGGGGGGGSFGGFSASSLPFVQPSGSSSGGTNILEQIMAAIQQIQKDAMLSRM